MRKFSWILALLTALAMVFIACPSEGGGGVDWDLPNVAWKYIEIPGRSQAYHTIDIRIKNNLDKFEDGKSYTITVYGAAPGGGGSIILAGAQSEQNTAFGKTAAVDGKNGSRFKVSCTLTGAELKAIGGDLRQDIRVNNIATAAEVATFWEVSIVASDGEVIYKLSTDQEVQTKAHNYALLVETGQGDSAVKTGITWIIGALGNGNPNPTGFVIDPVQAGGFNATTSIFGVPTSSLIGSSITLPTQAQPANATYRDIKWAITDKGANTGATLTANVISGTTVAGIIKVKGTVEKGLDGTADFVSDEFSIEIKAPEGLLIEDFENGAKADGADTVTEYLGDNTWLLGSGYKAVKFMFDDAVVDNANFSTVTITYIADNSARFAFLNTSGVNIERDSANNYIADGSWRGNWDLSISDPATQELTKVINIPDCGSIGGFRFDAKEDGNVTIKIISVYFELKEACDVCGQSPCVCFVAVESIVGAASIPANLVAGAEYTLPTAVLPTNATNKTIVWTIGTPNPSGAKIEGGKIVDTDAAGEIKLIGTIVNGETATTDKVFNFTITVVVLDIEDIVVVPDPTTSTLLSIAGNYTTGTKYNYDGKDWWVVASNSYDWADADETINADDAALEAHGAANTGGNNGSHSRLAIAIPNEAKLGYGTVRITYDLLDISTADDGPDWNNQRGVVIRHDADASSGNEIDTGVQYGAYKTLESGDDKVLEFQVEWFTKGYIAIAKNNLGAFLFRVSKIEYLVAE